jgi:DedD protein
MATPKKPEVDVKETPSPDLRGTLIKRLAVAGVLVAFLLGTLAFFDYLATTTPDEPELPVFTQPVPVAPKKDVSQPVTPTENLPEPPAPEPEPVVEPPAAPVVDAQPAVAPPPAPQKTDGAAEKIRPVPRSTATISKEPAAPAVTRQPRVAPEGTSAPPISPEAPAIAPTPVKPAARLVDIRPSPPAVAPTVRRLFSGFVLQAGVFSSAQLAEELHAKLTLSGVPSTLETRVQVGPFRTRAEAEAAQAKLRELGVETILVPPKGARP